MAFFDFLKPIVSAVAPIFLGPALGTAVTSILGTEEIVEQQRVETAQKQIALAGLKPGVSTGAMRKRTTVETLDAMGKVVKRKVTAGGVAVFQADVTAANRVARQVRKLDKRMPRKLVKQSEIARLKDEVTESALRAARNQADCPPKC